MALGIISHVNTESKQMLSLIFQRRKFFAKGLIVNILCFDVFDAIYEWLQ